MKSRPILFQGAMVRALLDGTKTQTRRAWRDQPPAGVRIGYVPGTTKSPYGEPGDQLWVREAWQHIEGGPIYDAAGGVMDSVDTETIYRASQPNARGRWKPSIHMPRWASRITLEITGVRVEKLNAISAADCWAEGIPHSPDVDPVHEYQALWERINGPDSWTANPWVWVIEFKRVKP